MSNQVEIFTRVPDAIAILTLRGVYRQCEVFTLDGDVYAKTGGGFIRLSESGTSTSHRVHKIVSNQPFQPDKLGRLRLPA